MNQSKLIAIVFACCFYSCKERQFADFIITNAVVYSADDSIPSATSLAITGNIIVAVGSNEEIMHYKGRHTEVKDLQSAFVMPGLNEGHGHIHSFGKILMELNLLNTKSWQEIIDSVAERVKHTPKGEWIQGRGWHQDKWTSTSDLQFDHYPYHDALSKISPDHPVVLTHASGHALFANKAAMDIAKISVESKSPTGGRIVKDNNQKILGVFEENAMDQISSFISEDKLPREKREELIERRALIASQKAMFFGITSFTDAGSSLEEIEVMKNLSDGGKLPLRLNVMMYHNKDLLFERIKSLPIYGKDHSLFKANAVKAYIDGALGSYGAWLLEPYADNPKLTGQNTLDLAFLDSLALQCKNQDLQLCVHAIGDRANREVLTIFERRGNEGNERWRIEHAQHIDPNDIDRFKKNKVIASMQAIHCTSDAPFVKKRLGFDRAKNTSYRWRTLIDRGVRMANGTDVPVESINPFECIYASVTRKRADNQFEFFPEEKMTREEALKSYTIWNAYASFEESIKGSLTPGKLADFIVLDRNLMTCSDLEILDTKVLEVYFNGKKIK